MEITYSKIKPNTNHSTTCPLVRGTFCFVRFGFGLVLEYVARTITYYDDSRFGQHDNRCLGTNAGSRCRHQCRPIGS